MDVYVFGAGASAAEGAPATSDFFAQAWSLLGPRFDPRVRRIWRFLTDVFGVEVTGPEAFACIPAVDEVISLVDWSLFAGQGLGGRYDLPRLYQVRQDLEYCLCAALDAAMGAGPPADGPHARFARAVAASVRPVALISLNYDTLLDTALAAAGLQPDYGLGDQAASGLLLAKLHGSLNWAHCPACGEIVVTARPVAHRLPVEAVVACGRCGNRRLRGLIISPTWRKHYGGARLLQVWDRALRAIQAAQRLTFVGYSLSPADVPLYHLIRRGMLARPGKPWPEIVVINHLPDGDAAARAAHQEAVAGRFRRLFGPSVRCDFSGFHGQL
jgi:hypothetical protein